MYSTAPANWAKGSPTPLQRYRWCILQPQLTGPRGVLLLCRDTADVFYSLSRLGQGESYSSAEIQPMCFTAPANGAQGSPTPLQRYSRCILQPKPTGSRGGLTPLQRYSRCILQPQPTGPRGSLTPLQRYSRYILQPSRLGQGESYLSAEI